MSARDADPDADIQPRSEPCAGDIGGEDTLLKPRDVESSSALADDDTLLMPRDSDRSDASADDDTLLKPKDSNRPAEPASVETPPVSGDTDRPVARNGDAPATRHIDRAADSAGEEPVVMTPVPGAGDEDDTVVLPPPQAGDTESPLQAGLPGATVSGVGFAAKLKRLGSESLIYGLSSILGRMLSYLLVFPYARFFNTAQNGVQSAVYTYVPILSIVFLLGMDVAYMRNAASAKDAGPRERKRAFTMAFAMVALGGAVLLALGLAAAPWVAPRLRLPMEAYRYLLAIVYTDSLIAVPYAHLRMAGRAMRYAVLRLVFVGVSISLNIVLIVYLKVGLAGIFMANLAANLAVLVLFLGDIARLLDPGTLRGAPWKALWRYALPLMPATLAVMIVENGDRMVLNWLPESVAQSVFSMSSKDVLGIYNFNYKLGVAMLLVVQMFRLAWTPFSLQHGRDSDAPQLFSRVLTAVMLLCSAAFLGLAMFIPTLAAIPAVHHYPQEATFWLGLPIVPVILLGYVFSGMYAIVTAGLYIERRTGILPWIAGAGAVINVAICVVASRHSMVAVAWATPASYALMAALGAWQSNRYYPVPFEWPRLAHLAAIVAAIFFADHWLGNHGWAPTEWRSVAAKVALLVAFPVLLFLTRFFRAGEWNALKRLAGR